MIDFPLPLLGFAAFSGTGKTTLLSNLLPLFKELGLRVGVVKHTHHKFDIDHPKKDSYIIRKAGAEQIVIASSKRTAIIIEHQDNREEPSLSEALRSLEVDKLDLVLVEGFKREDFPKIELYRKELGKPYLYPDDKSIIALASGAPLTDTPLTDESSLIYLDLNEPREIFDFIVKWVREKQKGSKNI